MKSLSLYLTMSLISDMPVPEINVRLHFEKSQSCWYLTKGQNFFYLRKFKKFQNCKALFMQAAPTYSEFKYDILRF